MYNYVTKYPSFNPNKPAFFCAFIEYRWPGNYLRKPLFSRFLLRKVFHKLGTSKKSVMKDGFV